MDRRRQTLDALQEKIGYSFADFSLLDSALTHPSAPGQARGRTRAGAGYERLEFLGDRALGLVVAEMLLERFADEDEGALSKRLVALVRKEALIVVAKEIDLAAALDLARGGGRAYERQRETAAADGVEALIGAMFLDGGYDAARAFVRRWWTPLLDSYSAPPKDPKTTLQEWAQSRGFALPRYRLMETAGPDHQPTFIVAVEVEGAPMQTASGRSKRAAEQAAASQMLQAVDAADAQ